MRLPTIGKLAALPLCAAALAAGGLRHREHRARRRAIRTTRARSCSWSTARAATRSTAAGTEGSAAKVTTRENKDGPNFNQRKESEEDVLYAIENGGFSSGPMPQNIVTGEDAQKIAAFIAKYSGPGAPKPGGD